MLIGELRPNCDFSDLWKPDWAPNECTTKRNKLGFDQMLHLADLRISVIDPRLPLWKQRSITCDHLSTFDQNHLWMQKSIKDQRLPRFPISRHHLIEYQRVKVKTKALLVFTTSIAQFQKTFPIWPAHCHCHFQVLRRKKPGTKKSSLSDFNVL